MGYRVAVAEPRVCAAAAVACYGMIAATGAAATVTGPAATAATGAETTGTTTAALAALGTTVAPFPAACTGIGRRRLRGDIASVGSGDKVDFDFYSTFWGLQVCVSAALRASCVTS